MTTNLFRIVYCSRNLISGDAQSIRLQLQSILASCRANNVRMQVTGALLYNFGNFAQILEGPLHSVESVFEKIQRDERHSEVTVIQSGPVDQRQFPEWSMAFASNSSIEGTPVATAAFDAVFAHNAGAGEQMLSLMRELVVDDADWVMMETARA